MRLDDQHQSTTILNLKHTPWFTIRLLLLLTGILFTVGCLQTSQEAMGEKTSATTPGKENTEVDISFITGEPCEPPCWYGLEPGISTKEDVYRILQQLPFVNQDSIRERVVTYNRKEYLEEISYSCFPNESEICGGLEMSDGILLSLFTSVNYDLTFAIAVDELGDPDLVAYNPHIPTGGCEVILNWISKRISVFGTLNSACPSLEKTRSGAKIDPNIKVNMLSYGHINKTWETIDNGGPYTDWAGFAAP